MGKLKLFAVGVAVLASGCAAQAPRESLVGDYLSGHFAAKINAVDEAAGAFAKAQGEAPASTDILKEAFFFHLAAGDIDAAAGYGEELVQRDEEGGDDGLALVALAVRAINNGDYNKARSVIADGVSAGYLSALVTILEGWAVAGAEGPDAALALLANVANDQFRGFNPLHEALLADAARRPDQALAAHQLSIMTFGGPVGRAAYGAHLERAGDDAAAREYYTMLLQDPGAARRAAQQGLARLERGAPTTAYKNTRPAQGAAVALYSYGAAFLEQAVNQRTAAERAGFNVGSTNYNLPLIMSQMALYLDPNLDDARRFVASILNVYGDHDRAIAELAAIKSSSPHYEQAQIETASALAALGREKEAISVLRNASRRDDTALELQWALANLYSSQERHTEAIKTLDRLIARLPLEPDTDSWRYFVSRGAALIAVDDWEKAEADLKRAAEIAPEEPTALNYLGYSWAERGVNLDEAFALIEKAVSLQPESGAIIDSLGWAHYQRGDYAQAVGHLEQAASLEPDDPTITDHLGDVYWRLGRKIEARYQWKHVQELDPPDDLAVSVKEKLKAGLAQADPER